MNAVVIETYDFNESESMPVNEKDDLAIQVAELRSDVRHIQEDVSDIKIEMRAAKEETNKRFDKTDARIDKLDDKVNGLLVRLESWKVWALGLYIGLAVALVGVMAKGFKWF